MNKVLTVSIAAYNVENYLKKTLDSFICDESHMNKLEIIIVNDGSKDRTIEIAKEYERRYPNTFKAIDKNNGGYGSTINTSLQLSTGKYFRTVDGDDWVDNNSLGMYIDVLERCDSDLVVTRFTTVQDVDGRSKIVENDIVYDGVEKRIEEVIHGDFISMHQSAYKTQLLKDINLRITEKCFYTDLEFMIKPLFYLHSCTCFDLNVYMYRVGREGQSVQLSSWQKNIDQATSVTLNLCDYYEQTSLNACNSAIIQYVQNSILGSVQSKYRILLSLPEYEVAKTKTIDFDKKLKAVSKKLYYLAARHGWKKHSVIIRIARLFDYKFMRIAYSLVHLRS